MFNNLSGSVSSFLGQAGLQIEQPLQIPDALAGLDDSFQTVYCTPVSALSIAA